ncbi:hypothetical protein TS71_22065 [Mycolicibacterium neoaurum]|uniref:Uncharacterized protein n=2 Tax=Mycobacteriaceae TaxID=1762 RepID=V5XJS0_MYCNE|nr:hypothetical protein D174_20125 [Mycolicibacterium neoaurum VKM Ac-1815D]AMO07030.1 hypothetical protein MyAD_19750 [Mycolicibacterium neoaurum]AXK74593.1 hypothetical protein DXK33_05185 [Mycolicibacterium neoaurum]KJQ48377.1 hypothetical protein TS71_22065 [Mycolicibacterium neoaurum]KUM06583.1 hypothetical protein AVZ31_20350 [Mycolicibacterium neoaurum]
MGQNVSMRVVVAALLATALVASASGCARGLPEVGKIEPAPMHAPPTVLLPPSSATFSPPLPQEPDDLRSDR